MTNDSAHPESYYDAKRALLTAAPVGKRGSYELREAIPKVLAALGWADPEPAKDERGKAVKVFAVEVRMVLPGELREEWNALDRDAASRISRSYDPSTTAFIVAANKSAAIDTVYGADRTRWSRPKTSEVGEVAPTRLGYEAAVSAPAGKIAVERREGEFVFVTAADFDTKD